MVTAPAVDMKFVNNPASLGKMTRYTSDKNAIYSVLVPANAASALLWFLSRRHILLLFSALNTSTLFMVREASRITYCGDECDDDNSEAQQQKNKNRKRIASSESVAADASPQKKRKKFQEADRLLLGAGSALASGAWSGQFALHAVRVFTASGEAAAMWRRTAALQVGVSVCAAAGLAYKSYVEGVIAYAHRYD